jgi:hypothetical protein
MQAVDKAKSSAVSAIEASGESAGQLKKKRIRYAVFLSYQGKNYYGMQVCFIPHLNKSKFIFNMF